MRLNELSGPQWEEMRGATVLLPVGSTEQHGPHLPMGTDAEIARMVCETAAAMAKDLVVAPPVPYGTSFHHHRLPGGAISLPGPLLTGLLVAVIDCLLRPDRRNAVMVVNGHGGNIPAILSALDEAGRQWGEQRVVACSWWDLIPDVIGQQRSGYGSVGHAGEVETAVLLHAMPDQVRTDRMPEGVPAQPPGMVTDKTFIRWHDFSRHFPDGVAGSPRVASAAFGEVALTTAAERLIALIRRLASDDSRAAGADA
jgi:creatinine amidohydrolase